MFMVIEHIFFKEYFIDKLHSEKYFKFNRKVS